MESKNSRNQLFVLSTTTLIVGLLVLTFIFINFFYGNIGLINKSLPTVFRLGLFLMLWFTTWWCVKKAIGSMTPKDLAYYGWKGSIMKGGLWGGTNGSITGGTLLVIATLLTILNESTSLLHALLGLLSGLFFMVFVVPIAFIVGALIGILGTVIVKLLVVASCIQELVIEQPTVE